MGRVPILPLICAMFLATLSGVAQNAPPVNDRANPYAHVGNWLKLPEGRILGGVSGVDIDRDGSSVWVADRCGGSQCVDSTIAPILKFDAHGRLVKAFGAGLFAIPHGVHVDRDGNIWVTDDSTMPAPGKGHQVIKFDPDGKVLLNVADSLSNPQTNAGWIRGIRIGAARDGAVSAFIPDATPEANPITAAEGVAVDAQGNVYGAVVPTPGLLRYVRK